MLGQILLARRMGKKRIIAETGAGQHGVATATACARFGLECVVYMGAVDVERQKPNVFRMHMLGAKVVPVQSGARTLKDAMNEALRDWVTNVDDTFYCIGTAAGPHPYPAMVRDFQCVIGDETRAQMLAVEGRLPDSLVACIGGGSNAIGLFHPFLDDPAVELYGVEAAGHGLNIANGHAASLAGGEPGVLHGNRTYLLHGRRRPDSRGPFDFGRAGLSRHRPRTRLAARRTAASPICRPPTPRRWRLSSSAPSSKASSRRWSRRTPLPRSSTCAPQMPKDHLMVLGLSGRGDKDIVTVADHLGEHVNEPHRRDASPRLQREDRPALVTFRHGRRSRPGDFARDDQGFAGGGRGHDRNRHAVLRPDGRRSRDPGRGPARAARRHDAEAHAGAGRANSARATPTTPIILMGYYNPIYVYGVERFLADAKTAGVDGLIVVDLPPEEDAELCLPALAAGLSFVRLATPTTDDRACPRCSPIRPASSIMCRSPASPGRRAPIIRKSRRRWRG